MAWRGYQKGNSNLKQEWVTGDGGSCVYWNRYVNPYPTSAPKIWKANYLQAYSSDLLTSQNNHKDYKGHYKRGGPFRAVKRTYSSYSSLGDGPIHFSPSASGNGDHEVTPQFARHAGFGNSAFPVVKPTPDADMLAFGRRAIAATSPTRSAFDGSEFLGELRSGRPRAAQLAESEGRVLAARTAGKNYLNLEFGWKPLLSDYRAFVDAYRNQDKIWDRYVKNSGKIQHRTYSEPGQNDTVVSEDRRQPNPVLYHGKSYLDARGMGDSTTTTKTTSKLWFSGSFVYAVPPRGVRRDLSRMNKIYGTNIDPSTLWEMAPWSWAVDWVSDADVLAKNVSDLATDGLVMPSGYIMETKSIEVTYDLRNVYYKSYDGPQSFRQSFKTTMKSRMIASPFGFQLKWDGLTDRQLAIAASVGVTR